MLYVLLLSHLLTSYVRMCVYVCLCIALCVVFTFNKVASEPSVQGQWAEIINLLASSASLLAVSPLVVTVTVCHHTEAVSVPSCTCLPLKVYQPKGLGGCMTVLMELSQHQNLEVDCRVKVFGVAVCTCVCAYLCVSVSLCLCKHETPPCPVPLCIAVGVQCH